MQFFRLIFFLFLACVSPADANTLKTSAGELVLTPMARGLDQPWAFGFLPDGGVLITERDGALLHLTSTDLIKVSGIPSVYKKGQGGLLDILVPRNFAKSRTLFFTFAKRQGSGAGTAVARARLSKNGRNLTGWTVIFEMERGSDGGRHFGSRIVEAKDGTLMITVGERGDRPSAQDLGRENGSIIRIHKDGGIPTDNPFVGTAGAQPEIWSYGHRNPQGAALDLQGRMWVSEHGAKGGDEVNQIRKGANYGWPVISYGVHYSGKKIGEGTAKPGMEQPKFYWDPSIAPSGLMIYSGKLWPQWRGDIFVGSLKFDYIARLDGTPLREVEQLKSGQTGRIRDIREAPDGSIWFLSISDGVLYRLSE